MACILSTRWTEKMKAVVVVLCLFQSVVNVQVVTSFKVYSNLPSVSATSTSHPSSPLSIVTSTPPPSATLTLSSRVSHTKSATATATSTVAATATAGSAVKLRTTTATAAAVQSTTVSVAAGVAAAGIGVGTLPKAAVAAAGAAATIGNAAITSTTYLGQKTEMFCQNITTIVYNSDMTF